jgi:hypothetical protein
LPVEIGDAIGPEPLDFDERRSGGCEERVDVDALTPWGERLQVARAARQHVYSTVVIPPPKMVEGDAYLQDTLIQAAHLALFTAPQQLQCLMLLEVLAAVELCNRIEQQTRWGFIAR